MLEFIKTLHISIPSLRHVNKLDIYNTNITDNDGNYPSMLWVMTMRSAPPDILFVPSGDYANMHGYTFSMLWILNINSSPPIKSDDHNHVNKYHNTFSMLFVIIYPALIREYRKDVHFRQTDLNIYNDNLDTLWSIYLKTVRFVPPLDILAFPLLMQDRVNHVSYMEVEELSYNKGKHIEMNVKPEKFFPTKCLFEWITILQDDFSWYTMYGKPVFNDENVDLDATLESTGDSLAMTWIKYTNNRDIPHLLTLCDYNIVNKEGFTAELYYVKHFHVIPPIYMRSDKTDKEYLKLLCAESDIVLNYI